ncbi:glycoside hydrolase family 13 protein [Salinimonas lutimaris]|uniref:glycoside hydrolase family 13 protein n=1 Tax=Salinimonas lutimaris TaxID=914153 RepID=UPI0010C0F53E|nr:glycoside hydrolase family 13 protein [Salinimonas lutimaris]
MKKLTTELLLAVLTLPLCSAVLASEHLNVYPPSWWAGMHHNSVQLMVYGENIGTTTASSPSLDITSFHRLDSDNYLFININTQNTVAGTYDITFSRDEQQVANLRYTLSARQPGSARRAGFSQADTIYLITPDRFANGNHDNDSVNGYIDLPARQEPGGRHGGDIKGIIDHLDYIEQMGFTQIWTMPMRENAMDAYSYHGYAMTDFYTMDPRYGSNEDYRTLSQQARQKGIGLIMDVVLNHIGSEHIWMKDAPSKDWIHNDSTFTPTTHMRVSLHDPHGVEADQRAFSDGWFVPTMPDLNQQNPYLATYMIQNAIWWTEYAGLSGIRVDTYSYSDKAFLSNWTRRLTQEYPNLNIVGEEWSVNPVITAYWQAGTPRSDGYQSYLPSVMDFPFQQTLVNALKHKESWGTGLVEMYELLATDFIYGDPYNLVIFADNHDMSRIFTQLDNDYALWDMAMTMLLTTRGIPQIYYGTEVLMTNPGTDDHGVIRTDFPGGWAGDKASGFSGQGLSKLQQQARARLASLLALRQAHPVVATGQYTHYAPQDGVYVYFRHQADADEAAMVVVNKNNEATRLPLARFKQMLAGFTSATRWNTKEKVSLSEDAFTLDKQSATVWLLH